MCDRFPDKSEHPYQHLAERAGILHTWAAPTCPGVQAYPCGDHYHVGHASKTDGDACKTAHPRDRNTAAGHTG